MKPRIATLLASKDLGAAGTEIINLNLKGGISRIDMVWDFTVVTVSVMTARVIDCITKIELVDGGHVIASITGSQAVALNCYNRKRMPHFEGSLTVGDHCIQTFGLDFGRWIHDEMLALVPTMFDNLQLRITWDEDAANGSVVVNSLSCYAFVMDDLAKTPQGYLSPQQVYSYAMAASGHEYINLPVDANIRQIMLQPESTDHDPVALLSNIKLIIDGGRSIPIDMTAGDFFKIIQDKYPRISYKTVLDDAVTAKTIYANVSRDILIDIQYDETDFVTAQSNFALPTYAGHVIALAASVDIKAQNAEISGTCPMNTLCWLPGDEWDISQALNVTGVDDIELDLTASAAADSGDTTRVIVEQIKSYVG